MQSAQHRLWLAHRNLSPTSRYSQQSTHEYAYHLLHTTWEATESHNFTGKWQKCSERCNIFTTLQTPFPGAQDGQNLISWRWSLPLPTNPVWWRSMHAISSYCGNRPANKHTHRHTNRTNYNTLHRSFASRQCNQLQLSFKFQHSCTLCTKNLDVYSN